MLQLVSSGAYIPPFKLARLMHGKKKKSQKKNTLSIHSLLSFHTNNGFLFPKLFFFWFLFFICFVCLRFVGLFHVLGIKCASTKETKTVFFFVFLFCFCFFFFVCLFGCFLKDVIYWPFHVVHLRSERICSTSEQSTVSVTNSLFFLRFVSLVFGFFFLCFLHLISFCCILFLCFTFCFVLCFHIIFFLFGSFCRSSRRRT